MRFRRRRRVAASQGELIRDKGSERYDQALAESVVLRYVYVDRASNGATIPELVALGLERDEIVRAVETLVTIGAVREEDGRVVAARGFGQDLDETLSA
jgi:hypothetical protein